MADAAGGGARRPSQPCLTLAQPYPPGTGLTGCLWVHIPFLHFLFHSAFFWELSSENKDEFPQDCFPTQPPFSASAQWAPDPFPGRDIQRPRPVRPKLSCWVLGWLLKCSRLSLRRDLKCTLSSLSPLPRPEVEEIWWWLPPPRPRADDFSSPGLGEGTLMRKMVAWFGQKGLPVPRSRGDYALCHLIRGSRERGEEVTVLRLLETGHRESVLSNRWRGLWTAEHQNGVLAEEQGLELGAPVAVETGRFCQKALHRRDGLVPVCPPVYRQKPTALSSGHWEGAQIRPTLLSGTQPGDSTQRSWGH